jgi:uncharacterized membrane protein YvbJ
MKFCPNCGAGVEAGAESCESCGVELAVVRSVVDQPGAPWQEPLPSTVAGMSPRQLRKEIRWGVFQGILLAAVIALVVYVVIVVLVAALVTTVASGGI